MKPTRPSLYAQVYHRLLYDCARIPEFAYDFLDGKLPRWTSLRFRAHLSGCRGCREYMRLYRMAADPKTFQAEHPLPAEMLASTLEFLKNEGAVDGDPVGS